MQNILTHKRSSYAPQSIKILVILAIIAFHSIFIRTPEAYAQTKNNITVSPQIVNLDLSNQSPEAEFTYTNNTSQTIELTLTLRDVKEFGEQGIPQLLDATSKDDYKYGLASWATFSNKNLVILPKESKKVRVFIDGENLSIGGHYGAILAEIKQIDDTKTVKLRAFLTSLLFVRSGGIKATEMANIIDFEVYQRGFGNPIDASFRFQNTGNVDLTPYGTISIYNMDDQLIEKTVINENSSITLPESTRVYKTPFKNLSIKIPGLYKAVLSVNYGDKDVKVTKELTFFTLGGVNKYGISAFILIFALLLFLKFNINRRKQAHDTSSDN